MEVQDITIETPFFAIIFGKSNGGKTFFTNRIVDEWLRPKKKNTKVIYVVNVRFEVEKPIIEKAEKDERIHIITAGALEKNNMDNIINIISSIGGSKLLIFDNFTYSLSYAFLDFITFARKYKASTIFITHSLYALPKIYPRLKEQLNYLVLFYQTNAKAKQMIGDDLENIYKKEIHHRDFKKMIIDYKEEEYMIAGPDYVPKIKFAKEN